MERPLAYLLIVCANAGLLTASGCYHNMYTQPYGSTPYGSTYPQAMPYQQAPIQTLTPGQPYVPGSGTPSAIPQGGTPTYQMQGGGLQPIPDNSAPPFNSGGNPGNSPLPGNPYGPGAYMAPTGQLNSGIQQAGLTQPMPLGPPASGLRPLDMQSLPSASPYVPVQPMKSTVPMPMSIGSAPSADSFAAPVMGPPPGVPVSPIAPFGTSSTVPAQSEPAAAEPAWNLQANKVTSTGTPAFGNDAKFKWLRGVVAREPQDGTWSIIYNDNPKADDRWAGHLSLSPNPQLDGLRDGEFVEVRGEVDAVVCDRTGKPVYAVNQVNRLSVAKQ